MKRLFASLCLIITLHVTPSLAATLTLDGPTLTSTIHGWSESGLQITALEDVTLLSFVFNNQGSNDTILLKNIDGTTLYTHNHTGTGGLSASLIDVTWYLAAGTTYRLISEHGSNGRWTSFFNFPVSNAHIRVDGTTDGASNLITSYWFTFTELTTTTGGDPIPEPATALLLGGGLLVPFIRKRAR